MPKLGFETLLDLSSTSDSSLFNDESCENCDCHDCDYNCEECDGGT